jgi:hypothetical protein
MAFNFDTFGEDEASKPTTSSGGGFNFESFGAPVDANTSRIQRGYEAVNRGGLLDRLTNAPFKSETTDSGVTAGLKAVGNLPSSALGTVVGAGRVAVNAVRNPIKTLTSIDNVLLGGTEKLSNMALSAVKPDAPQSNQYTGSFDAVTSALKERYGSLDNLKKTATEDPFGFGSDVLGLITGGAAVAGKAGLVENAISKAGKVVTTPVSSVASKAADVVKGTSKFTVSQATGLNPSTIEELLKNPSAFKGVTPEIRVETANAVKEALDTRLSELSDMGKGYQSIREGTAGNGGLVTIPENTVKNVLDKYGVKLDAENKIITSVESRPLSNADKASLQDFIDNYGSVTTHTNNSFLNTREALSNLSKYESGKTNLTTQIARDLRSQYDKAGKSQIKGLSELDAQYAPERQLLGDLKSEIFDTTGELKQNAVSKIANINGKGKEQLLSKMKEIIPDIDQRVKIIKAVEDIAATQGIKVGTYSRTLTQVGGGLGVLTGNIPAIVAAVLSQPEIAVPLLKGAGYVGNKAAPILNAIKAIANDINTFKIPAPVLDYARDPKMGLSITDVTKKIHPDDIKLMQDFIDHARIKTPLSDNQYQMSEKLAQKFGISMDKGISNVANKFDNILSGKTEKIVGTKVPGSVKSKLSVPRN